MSGTSDVTKTSGRSPARGSARERLLAAADELFYAEGVHTVGIDRVIERAGVAKASLYNTFGSKDELVRAYLELRFQVRRDTIMAELATVASPREKLLVVFDLLDQSCRRPTFHGCAFVNASAEAQPGSAAEQVPAEVRRWMRALFVQLATEAGATDPAKLAAHLQLLYDGAAVSARLDRDPGAAATARVAAAALIDAALPVRRAARRAATAR